MCLNITLGHRVYRKPKLEATETEENMHGINRLLIAPALSATCTFMVFFIA